MRVRPSSWLASVMSGRISNSEHDRAGQIVHDLASALYYASELLDGESDGVLFGALANLEQMFFETVARNALKAAGCTSMQALEPTPAALRLVTPPEVA